jgi:2-hydroxy-6-oxonona-2,4-dienedioate hydrolase
MTDPGPADAGVRFVDVDGVRTAYREAGEGRPVLLLHGGDFRSFGSSHDWQPVIPLLAERGFRVIALDKLGQGFTALPPEGAPGFTMAAVHRHAEAFVECLGLERYAVIGHSRGALPAAILALDHPERVTELVIVDSSTLGPVSPLTPTDFYRRAYAGMSEPPGAADVRRELDMNSHSRSHVDDAAVEVRLAIATQRKAAAARRIMGEEEAFAHVFVPDAEALRAATLRRLGALVTPTLIIWGREDPSAPLGIGQELYRLIATVHPASVLEIIDDAGHYVFREQPRRFAELVGGFVGVADER